MSFRLALHLGLCVIAAFLIAAAPSVWYLGVLLVIGGGLAILKWPSATSERATASVFRAKLTLGILLGLLVPACIGFVSGVVRIEVALSRGDPSVVWNMLLVTTVGICVALAMARHWPATWPDGIFLALLGGTLLAGRFAYLVMVEVEPSSDFRGMWNLAGFILRQGTTATVVPNDDHRVWLHFQRILPSLLPWRALLGESRWAYVLPNFVSTFLCSLLTYHLTRRWFDRIAARAAFLLSMLAIEPILASGIPTHDIPGALYTLLAFAAFFAVEQKVRTGGSWRLALLGSVSLGLLLVVVDLQRSNRTFLLLAFGTYLFVELIVDLTQAWRRSSGVLSTGLWPRRLGLVIAVPLVVMTLGEMGLRAYEWRIPPDLKHFWQARAIAGHSDSWATGRYQYAFENYYKRFNLTADEWRSLALRKFLTDLAHNPGARSTSMTRRAARVMALGSQMGFYLHDAQRSTGYPMSNQGKRKLAFVNHGFVLLFLPLLVLGTLSVCLDLRVSMESLIPALYLAMLTAVLLVAFQTQPRYLFQIWYLGAIYAGALFRHS